MCSPPALNDILDKNPWGNGVFGKNIAYTWIPSKLQNKHAVGGNQVQWVANISEDPVPYGCHNKITVAGTELTDGQKTQNYSQPIQNHMIEHLHELNGLRITQTRCYCSEWGRSKYFFKKTIVEVLVTVW